MIGAIKELYREHLRWSRFGGACIEMFTITPGVKQDCPLSPLLFVIATDGFLRALEANMGPKSLVRAYADDIALVLHRSWKEVGIMANLFSKLETIVGLCLKPKKCVLIPLWVGTVGASFSALLKEEEPRWAGFEID